MAKTKATTKKPTAPAPKVPAVSKTPTKRAPKVPAVSKNLILSDFPQPTVGTLRWFKHGNANKLIDLNTLPEAERIKFM